MVLVETSHADAGEIGGVEAVGIEACKDPHWTSAVVAKDLRNFLVTVACHLLQAAGDHDNCAHDHFVEVAAGEPFLTFAEAADDLVVQGVP